MKNLGKIFFGVLLGMAAMFCMERGCKHKNADRAAKVAAREETNVIADIAKHRFDTTKHYTDLDGHEHATKALVQGDAAAMEIFYKKRFDSIARLLHIKNNQLKDMVDIMSRASGTFTASVDNIPVPTVDDTTLGGSPFITGVSYTRHFAWRDSFMTEEGWVDTDKAVINYSMNMPVSITSYWKRSWLLGRKHYFIDGYSPNPNVHISGLTGLSINKK